MKICVLAYNFRHKKTQDVFSRTLFEQYKSTYSFFAANKVKLNFYKSKERVN